MRLTFHPNAWTIGQVPEYERLLAERRRRGLPLFKAPGGVVFRSITGASAVLESLGFVLPATWFDDGQGERNGWIYGVCIGDIEADVDWQTCPDGDPWAHGHLLRSALVLPLRR